MAEKLHRNEVPDMGKETSKVFAGYYKSETNKEMYAETAKFFADKIRDRLPVRENPYTIADIGAFQGELLGNIISLLPEYKFKTTAIDINADALLNNKANQKTNADVNNIPLPDQSVDIAIMRYVLQFNSIQKQREIIREIARIIKSFALIEHVGADIEETEEWRDRMDKLFRGQDVPKLLRTGYFFSSRAEIEAWFKQGNINFERLKDKKINNAMDVYIERYDLDKGEAEKAINIMGDKNYFRQTDWVIYPKNT